MMSPRRAAVLTGYAALGPITGPLVAGIFRNWTKGEYVLVGLYVTALGLAWLDLAGLAAWSAHRLM